MTKSGLLQIQSILKSCGKGQDLFPQDVPKVVASPHATHSYYSLWCNAMHKYYPDIPMTPWKAYEFKNAKCFSCLGAKAIDFFDVIIGDVWAVGVWPQEPLRSCKPPFFGKDGLLNI
jgi:hypothetical protein